ncbi:MAG TPA: branched-chain amino acid ABC transporter permease [Sulfolobales archaeon]|nr:branched-chain amino acid ABC transporter permease [Sulfolobales archaeon]
MISMIRFIRINGALGIRISGEAFDTVSQILRTSLPGVLVVLVLLILGLLLPAGFMATIRNILVYICLSIPWVLFFSLGYPSFATGAFYGVGAYIFVYSLLYGFGPLAGIVVSVLVAVAVAAAIGYVTLRLAGLFFFFATLAILEALRQVLLYIEINFTGHVGKIVPIIISDQLSLLLLSVLSIANVLIYSYMRVTRHRIYMSVVRSDKILAVSHGLSPYRYSLGIFILTSALQSICGSVSALYLLYIDPNNTLNPLISLLTLIIGLVGGSGNTLGPILSSIIVVSLYEYTSRIASYLNLVIIGVVVMVFVLYLRTSISDLLDKYLSKIPRGSSRS